MWYRTHIGGDRCPIVDTWWQTETGGIMITPLPGHHRHQARRGHDARSPASPPTSSTTTGRSVGNGEGGYLVITEPWPGMLRGIWGDPERYRETYWSRFPGRYFAGDGAKRDEDGDLWLLGRVDDVMNISGHRISTTEVEHALVGHPSVAEAAVVGAQRRDDRPGDRGLRDRQGRRGPTARPTRRRSSPSCATTSPTRSARSPSPARSCSRPSCRRPAAARSCAGCCATSPSTASSATSPRCSTRPSSTPSRTAWLKVGGRGQDQGRRLEAGECEAALWAGVLAGQEIAASLAAADHGEERVATRLTRRAAVKRSAEAEDAAVRHQPVAAGRRVGGHADDGWSSGCRPSSRRSAASPKLKIPPSPRPASSRRPSGWPPCRRPAR